MPLAETQVNEQGAETPFAPSLFSQVHDALKTGALKPADSPETPLEADDIQGVLEMPFDVAAFITKVDELGLSPEESKKLCKIWLKPMQKLLGRYPKADLIIAATVTMGIITEKVIIFYMVAEKREKERLAKQREASNPKESKQEEVASARESFTKVALNA